jgi:glycosyltransferase involved in cell wall biosynthesis
LAGDLSSGPIADKMKSYIEQLHTRIDECGLSDRVSFLGWRDDIRELLTAADVYVHPSRWEGWPLAVMEAMGEAKPIVTSDCVGEPEGFKAGIHGYIFRNKDVNELTKCLQRVLARNDYKTMGVACRDLARANYDIAVLSRRFVEAVESTIESSSNSHPST